MSPGSNNQWKDASWGWKLFSIVDQIQVTFLDRFVLFKHFKESRLILEKKKIVQLIGLIREPFKGLSTLKSSFHKTNRKHLLIMHPCTELKNLGLFKRYNHICILKKALCLHFSEFWWCHRAIYKNA